MLGIYSKKNPFVSCLLLHGLHEELTWIGGQVDRLGKGQLKNGGKDKPLTPLYV